MLELVGDVGGTNCRFALMRRGGLDHSSQRSYANADFATLPDAIQHYLLDMQVSQVRRACLGVAGPVQKGQARLTNYPWAISEPELAAACGAAQARLMNDLQAQGYALPGLAGGVSVFAGAGQPAPDAPRMLVAIGTGVNVAVAHFHNGKTFVPASETGHIALPVADETDLGFARFVREKLGHCPIEAALSGAGLARLWRFFGGLQQADGASVMAACADGDHTAQQAVQRQVWYLAQYCADLGLVHLPFGGIFLSGSVGWALAPWLTRFGFSKAFQRPGPYQHLHAAMPVIVAPKIELGLMGCANWIAQAAD